MTAKSPIKLGMAYLLYPCVEGWCLRKTRVELENSEQVPLKRAFGCVGDALGCILDLEQGDEEGKTTIEATPEEAA